MSIELRLREKWPPDLSGSDGVLASGQAGPTPRAGSRSWSAPLRSCLSAARVPESPPSRHPCARWTWSCRLWGTGARGYRPPRPPAPVRVFSCWSRSRVPRRGDLAPDRPQGRAPPLPCPPRCMPSAFPFTGGSGAPGLSWPFYRRRTRGLRNGPGTHGGGHSQGRPRGARPAGAGGLRLGSVHFHLLNSGDPF